MAWPIACACCTSVACACIKFVSGRVFVGSNKTTQPCSGRTIVEPRKGDGDFLPWAHCSSHNLRRIQMCRNPCWPLTKYALLEAAALQKPRNENYIYFFGLQSCVLEQSVQRLLELPRETYRQKFGHLRTCCLASRLEDRRI